MARRGITRIRRVLLDTLSVHTVLLTGLVGCGGPHRAAVYPVVGTLTVSGQPAANAMVAFHRLGKDGAEAALSVASTGPDGTYRLMTYAAGDGAPAGEYAVTVIWPDDSRPRDECEEEETSDRLKGRYADPARSPWRVTVARGKNELPLRADLPADGGSLPGLRDSQEGGSPATHRE